MYPSYHPSEPSSARPQAGQFHRSVHGSSHDSRDRDRPMGAHCAMRAAVVARTRRSLSRWPRTRRRVGPRSLAGSVVTRPQSLGRSTVTPAVRKHRPAMADRSARQCRQRPRDRFAAVQTPVRDRIVEGAGRPRQSGRPCAPKVWRERRAWRRSTQGSTAASWESRPPRASGPAGPGAGNAARHAYTPPFLVCIGADVDAWGDTYWRDFDNDWWREEIAQGLLLRSRIDLFLQNWLTMRVKDEIPTDAVFAQFRNHAAEHLARMSRCLLKSPRVVVPVVMRRGVRFGQSGMSV